MANSGTAGSSIRLLSLVLVTLMLLSPIVATLGFAPVGTAAANDGIHYVTDSGFEIEDTSGGAVPDSGNPFPDSDTLDLPGINLSAAGNSYVTLEQRNGTFTNLSSVDDDPTVTVTPEDKQEVALMGGFDSLNVSDASYLAANSAVDIAYSASGDATLRLESTGLSSGVTVNAVDVDSDTTLDSAAVASNGSVTFSALSSGDHVVNLETGAPSISSFSASNPSSQDVKINFDSDKQLSTIDVTISGAESASLSESDFSETDNGGTYTYEATYSGSSDGTYDVSLDTAEDAIGNDGASGESDSVDVSTGGGGGGGDDDDDDDDDASTSTSTPAQTDTPTSTSTPAQTDTPTSTSTSSSDGTDGTSSDDQQRPSGETSEDEEFVDPSEISDIEIVDVRLVTTPANSVNATSIVTLENPSAEDQTVDVRFVINDEVVEQREVVVPAEQRINATHSEVVEESGMHEVAANLAIEGGDETVRTFDFRIGTVELDESGEEVASSSAEPPSGPDQVDATDGQQSDDGGANLPVVLLGLVAVIAAISGTLYWQRQSE